MITDNDIGSLFTNAPGPRDTQFRLVRIQRGGLDAVVIPSWITTGAEMVVPVSHLVRA